MCQARFQVPAGMFQVPPHEISPRRTWHLPCEWRKALGPRSHGDCLHWRVADPENSGSGFPVLLNYLAFCILLRAQHNLPSQLHNGLRDCGGRARVNQNKCIFAIQSHFQMFLWLRQKSVLWQLALEGQVTNPRSGKTQWSSHLRDRPQSTASRTE